MKKVLIWNEGPLVPAGGPAGYLYNLKTYITEKNIKDIDFLNDLMGNDICKESHRKKKKFENIRKVIRKLRRHFFKTRKLLRHLNKEYTFYNGDYSFIHNYDIIHFHSVSSFYRARNILKTYQGKTLLTSHCPKTPAQEKIEDVIKMDYTTFPIKLKNMLEKIDQESFKMADYIIFPCKEAQQPYEDDKNIKDILCEKEAQGKILYIPTGIPLKEIKKDECFFNNRGINTKDKFIVSYIGRHIKVKGYDFLRQLGEKILQEYNNVIFIIAGDINDQMLPLQNKNWIELGWTQDGYHIIKNSHLFILPNEKTYFDLVLLEALSMGTPILLSNTGGNRYFRKYHENGLFYFEKHDLQGALERFVEIYNLWQNKTLQQYAEKNHDIFNKNFTVDIFANNYIQLYNQVR